MNDVLKLIMVVLLSVGIYFLSSRIVPGLTLLEDLTESRDWISSGLWVQATLLICSILLILILGRGKFTDYGFRTTGIGNVVKPAFIAFFTALGLFILNIIHIRLTGIPGGGGKGPLSGNLLQDIIYVWIIASFVEELFFRGFIVTYLKGFKDMGIKLGRTFLSLPVITAAVLFSLMHLCLWDIMAHRIVYFILINTFFIGLIAGYWREKTGSLIPAYAVHLIFNVVGMMIPRLLMSLAK